MESDFIEKINRQFADSEPIEVLKYFLKTYKGKIGFASSMGAEDQILTEMIVGIDPSARIFTLDTGRIFPPETYDLIEKPTHVIKLI